MDKNETIERLAKVETNTTWLIDFNKELLEEVKGISSAIDRMHHLPLEVKELKTKQESIDKTVGQHRIALKVVFAALGAAGLLGAAGSAIASALGLG